VTVLALTLPATLLWAYASGVVLAACRVVRAARRSGSAPAARDDLLLLLCAGAPLAAASTGLAPALGGVRPFLLAMPFGALLAVRALVSAARTAWPPRVTALLSSLALLILYPGLRAAAHAYPLGASAWNELAGGAPGAASLGMQRQDGGEAIAAVLETVSSRARPAARVWWADAAPAAIAAYARDGRLRPDLSLATRPEEADVAVVPLDGASRDAEYRGWTAFGSARPAAGVYLDEVPLVLVYARPGAWR
jgi:hypothetical protein